MTSENLESVAESLVADGKGILAADETVPTLTKRFDTLGIKSTEQTRRTYREMLFTCPGAAEYISGQSCMTKRSVRRVRGACPSPRLLQAKEFCPASRLTPAQNP